MPADRILVVDDEPGVRSALQGILGDEGFEVATAASGEDGLAALEAASFDAILLDIWLPGKDGIEVLVELRDRRIDAEVIMISGHGTIETAVRATKLGAFDFVEKPLSLERILLVVRNALRQRRLERRNRALVEQIDRDTEIVGTSQAAEQLRALLAAAAAVEAPVLLRGEPGSGRETVARRIHAIGSRAGEAFVTVPCAALDPASTASTLFGGPGAGSGRLALARGGTLYLEDLDRLDAALQGRLAADLGARDGLGSEVRFIGGTSPAASGIAPALLTRIEVIRIDVPALRERREDIVPLAERFMKDLSREYGRAIKRFDRESLRALTAHSWPGNILELRNLVERLLLLSPEETLRVDDLPASLGGRPDARDDLYREFSSLKDGLESFERYYIRRVLAESRGDNAAACARLGLTAAVLRDRRNKLGLT